MKPPKTIYLQWHGEDEPIDPDSPVNIDDVTWCADKIFDSDIEYYLPQWHDAKEMPKEDGFYIVAVDTGTRMASAIATFSNGRWAVGDYSLRFITHWMPLPQPPEEK